MATLGTRPLAAPQDAAFFAARRAAAWSRHPISPTLRILLWSLRLYVILMLAVVVVALTRILQ